MVIVFIGPPGSGKGTQAQILKDTKLPNLHILTVSSLLKDKSNDGSLLGDEIKNKMDNGDLIDDTVVISVLKEKVENLKDEQILIDGFPRSSVQALALKDIFNENTINVINFTVSDHELLQRIKKKIPRRV
jgi:adenylate kinase